MDPGVRDALTWEEQRKPWDWIPSWLINYEAFQESTNESFSEIGLVAAATLSAALCFFVYFTFRRWKDPGWFSVKHGLRPPDLPGPQHGLFAWARALLKIPESEFTEYVGFDGLVYIRFYLLAAKICLAFSGYALCVILPINAMGRYHLQSGTVLNSFSRISMSNIVAGSPRLWAHTVGIFLLTAIAFFFLNGEFKTYTKLRHQYLKLRAPHMRTIMLENLPEDMRSNAKLFVYFNTLYPNSVSSVACAQDLRPLAKLLARRLRAVEELERAMCARRDTGKIQAVWTGCCPGCGHRRDAVEHWSAELQFLNNEVGMEQARRLHHLRKMDKKVLGDQWIRSLPLLGDLLNEDDMGPIEHYLKGLGGQGQLQESASSLQDLEDRRAGVQFVTQAWGRARTNLKRFASHLTGSSALGTADGRTEEAQALLPSAPKDKALHFPHMAPKAYVTFKTFSAATVARQVHHASKPGRLKAVEAPEPRDIYWQNTYRNRRSRGRTRLLADAFLVVLYVFYVVPVTLLYLVLSEEALVSRSHWIREMCRRYSPFEALIELLQPTLLLGLMSLLPPLIRGLGIAEGAAAESSNQQMALSRYFSFQVINVFLVTTLAGSIFNTLSIIVQHPSDTFVLLGESLPKVCGFFVEYIFIKCFVGLWLELARILSVVQGWLLRVFWHQRTPRDRRAVVLGCRPYRDAGWFNFPKYYAQDLLVVVVSFTYACVNPFILVPALTYFFCAHLVYKHQMLYVYDPIYETGGAFFPKVFRRFIFAIVVAQATVLGVLILKSGYYQAGCVGFLMVVTLLFKGRQRGWYEPVALSLPLEIATSLDLEESRLRAADLVEDRDAYLQPELKAEPLASPELDDETDSSCQGLWRESVMSYRSSMSIS